MPGESLLLLDDPALKRLDRPAGEASPQDPASPLPVAKAEENLARAERQRQRWEKLVARGILAPVEYEKAVLQAARARCRCAEAHAAEAQAALEMLRGAEQPSAAALGPAEAAVEAAQRAVGQAAAALQQTRLQQAELNLDRQRRLAALGAGSRSQLKLAESALAKIKAGQP